MTPFSPLLPPSHPDFPVNALPEIIRQAVWEVSTNTKAPLALISASALGALSLACQGRLNVCRMGELVSPCSLYLVTIADSGERKTSVDSLFTAPHKEIEEAQLARHQQAMIAYDAERLAWEVTQKGILSIIEKKALKGEDAGQDEQRLASHLAKKPTRPRRVKLRYDDATPEALLMGLYEHSPSAALMSDEAGSIFHGRALDNLPMLNKLWDGGDIVVDRRRSGSITLKNARLTVALMVQDGVIRQYLERRGSEARDSGFLARCLVAHPPSTQGFRSIHHPTQSWHYLPRYQARLKDILLQNGQAVEQAEADRVCLSFTPEAQSVWLQSYNEIEHDIAPGRFLSGVKDYGAKIADNLARLAALFHFVEHGEGLISVESVERANQVCIWYANEFVRLFAPGPALPQDLADAHMLENWLLQLANSRGTTSFKKNFVRQYGPNVLRNKVRFDAAIECLVANQRIWLGCSGKTRFVNLFSPERYHLSLL